MPVSVLTLEVPIKKSQLHDQEYLNALSYNHTGTFLDMARQVDVIGVLRLRYLCYPDTGLA